MNESLRIVIGVLAVVAAGVSITLVPASRDIRAAHARARGAQLLLAAKGQIEYVVVGHSAPVLLIHGTSGGFVQGRLLAEMLGGPYRYITPRASATWARPCAPTLRRQRRLRPISSCWTR